MNSKIIFIEGNPGSGKTTFAKRLETALLQMGKTVKMFQEGDLHPIDLAWCAILEPSIYQKTILDYPMLKDDILRLSKKIGDQYVVAYTKVNGKLAPKSFYETMANYEIYRSESLEPFKAIHQKLWREFPSSMDPDTIYIFECIYIQNHINELILKYHMKEEEIVTYFKDLIEPLIPYHPTLFFIEQNHVEHCIQRVANERKTDDPTRFKDWLDLVIEYIENTPYASKLGYTGYDGIIRYFNDRQTLSLKLLESLPMTSKVLLLDHNYDELFEQMLTTVLAN